jgi:rhodanese-related sulfurtransferase
MRVEELKERLDAGEEVLVVDVREPAELRVAPYPFEVVPIPLGQLQRRLDELPREREIVVACRSGARSAMAVQFLHRVGYPRAVNLEGGILAWSSRIDPRVPTY